MINRILCLAGIHAWHYRLSEVGYVPLRGWPIGTTCQHCGKSHPDPLPPIPIHEDIGPC
jgi:hypothetical protein